MMILLDDEAFGELRTDAGGWTKATTDLLGVPWPLRHGWKAALLAKGLEVTPEYWALLMEARETIAPLTQRLRAKRAAKAARPIYAGGVRAQAGRSLTGAGLEAWNRLKALRGLPGEQDARRALWAVLG